MATTGNMVFLEPFRRGAAVTPHDTNTLNPVTDALYVGGAGNVVVTGIDGADYTLTGALAGHVYNVAVTRVKATGTTAGNLVALYR